MIGFRYFLTSLTFILSFFIGSPSWADMPLPKRAEDSQIKLIIHEAKEIFVYQSAEYGTEEFVEKGNLYTNLAGPYFSLADQIIKEKIEKNLEVYKSEIPAKIYFERPSRAAMLKPHIEISYQYDAIQASIQNKDILLGSLQFNLKFYPADKGCPLNAGSAHSIALNPESFIISESLKDEQYDNYLDQSAAYRAAVMPKIKVEKIHSSFDEAISRSIQDVDTLIKKFLYN